MHRIGLGQLLLAEAEPAADALGGEVEQALVDDVAGMLEVEAGAQELGEAVALGLGELAWPSSPR